MGTAGSSPRIWEQVIHPMSAMPNITVADNRQFVSVPQVNQQVAFILNWSDRVLAFPCSMRKQTQKE